MVQSIHGESNSGLLSLPMDILIIILHEECDITAVQRFSQASHHARHIVASLPGQSLLSALLPKTTAWIHRAVRDSSILSFSMIHLRMSTWNHQEASRGARHSACSKCQHAGIPTFLAMSSGNRRCHQCFWEESGTKTCVLTIVSPGAALDLIVSLS